MIPSNLIILLSLIVVVLIIKFIHWTIVVHSVNMKLYDSLGEEAVKWILEDRNNVSPEINSFKLNFGSSDLRLAIVSMLSVFKNIPR